MTIEVRCIWKFYSVTIEIFNISFHIFNWGNLWNAIIFLIWIRVHSRPMRAKKLNPRRKIFWSISGKKCSFRSLRGKTWRRIDCTISALCFHFMYFVWTTHKTAGISHPFLQSPWIAAYWFFIYFIWIQLYSREYMLPFYKSFRMVLRHCLSLWRNITIFKWLKPR
jgi:hypothetical protein